MVAVSVDIGKKYFHYTSRQIAQEIVIAKNIRPRSTAGRIYLTQETFAFGADAAAKLSIVGKPIEVFGIIPAYIVEHLLENPDKPQQVDPIIGPNGLDIRPGCSTEYFTKPGEEIVVDSNLIHWYSMPLP